MNNLFLYLCLISIIQVTAEIVTAQSQPGKKDGNEKIDLASQWKFKSYLQGDGRTAEWNKSIFTDNIELPGSCEKRGYGVKATKLENPWVEISDLKFSCFANLLGIRIPRKLPGLAEN